MRIVKSVRNKICVDGSVMKEFVLDEPLPPDFLRFLEGFGTVRTYAHMRRPFFSFEQENFISVKGFVGDTSVEVRYAKTGADLTGDYFHLLLYYFRNGDSGALVMKGIAESMRQKMAVRLPRTEGS